MTRSGFGVLGWTLVLACAPGLWAFDLDEVTVTGTRTEKRLADTPVVTEVIDASELKDMGVSDLSQALAAYGLIADASRAHGDNIQIEGLGGDRILVLVDGRRVTGRVRGNLDAKSLALANVERIEIIRGPQSALYGSDAMGGVINVVTKAPAPRLSVEVENTSLPAYDNPDNSLKANPNGAVLFQSQRATVDAGGSWNGLDGALTLTGSLDHFYYEELGETSKLPRGWNLQGTGEVRGDVWGGRWTALAGATTAREEDQSDFTGSLNRRDLGRAETSVGWEGPWSDGSLKVRLGDQGYSRSTASYSGGNQTWTDPSVEYQNATSAEAWYTRGWGDHLIATLGTDASWTLVHSPDLQKSLVSADQEAVVGQLEWYDEGRYSVVGGGRLERDSRFGFFAAPKVSAMAVVAPGWRVLAGVGVGYRAPTAEDLYYDIDWSDHPIVHGNTSLVPESSLAGNLGLEWAVPQGPSARFNAFHQELFNEIVYVQTGVDAATERAIYQNQNKDRTLRSGYDAEASLPWGPWALDGSVGYVFAWDRKAQTELVNVGGYTNRAALRFGWQGLTARVSARYTTLTELTVVDASVRYAWNPHFETSVSASNLTSALNALQGPFTPVSITLGVKAQM